MRVWQAEQTQAVEVALMMWAMSENECERMEKERRTFLSCCWQSLRHSLDCASLAKLTGDKIYD
jgi:hypothetical protein